MEETFELTPLPCWAHLTPDDYRQRVAELVEAIGERGERRARQDPTRAARSHHHPAPDPGYPSELKEEVPGPLYHVATRAVRKAFWEAYATFVAAFREAADRWREGDRSARFPIGSFPPGLPFVKAEAIGLLDWEAADLDPQPVTSMRSASAEREEEVRLASAAGM